MTDRFPDILNPAVDSDGNVLSGARLFFYRVGTSTKKNTYSDSAKSVANANPVIADSGGRFGDIFMLIDEQYKVILADSTTDDPPTTPIDTWDNVSPVRENPVASISTTAKSTDYTILTTDKGFFVLVDASSGGVTVTLLPAATAADGFPIYVKKIDSSTNTVTIDGDSAETIDGSTTFILTDQYDVAAAVSDGTTWHILIKSELPAAVAADFGSVAVVSATGAYTLTPVAVPARNYLINGDFILDQRRGDGTAYTAATAPANIDDQYLLDRWVLLSDGNDRADINQETTIVPTGVYSAIKFEVETVSGTSEKFGILQIIEARDAAEIIGGVVSLAFQARTTSGAVENLRAHILSWDSTADTVTSDVVATWEAEGSNPTFATNWTAENTGSDLSLSDTYNTLKVENVSIDTINATNVAIFIHVDDTDLVANDLLYISDVRLNKGPTVLPTARRGINEEVLLCQRFYQKSYNLDVIPSTITNNGHYRARASGTAHQQTITFATRMHGNPTLTFYNPATGTAGQWRDFTATTNKSAATVFTNQASFIVSLTATVDLNNTGGHWTAVAEL